MTLYPYSLSLISYPLFLIPTPCSLTACSVPFKKFRWLVFWRTNAHLTLLCNAGLVKLRGGMPPISNFVYLIWFNFHIVQISLDFFMFLISFYYILVFSKFIKQYFILFFNFLWLYISLFYFILFYFILFYFILFYFLFYFYFILFYFILFI